jgi:hypothetical protein
MRVCLQLALRVASPVSNDKGKQVSAMPNQVREEIMSTLRSAFAAALVAAVCASSGPGAREEGA